MAVALTVLRVRITYSPNMDSRVMVTPLSMAMKTIVDVHPGTRMSPMTVRSRVTAPKRNATPATTKPSAAAARNGKRE